MKAVCSETGWATAADWSSASLPPHAARPGLGQCLAGCPHLPSSRRAAPRAPGSRADQATGEVELLAVIICDTDMHE